MATTLDRRCVRCVSKLRNQENTMDGRVRAGMVTLAAILTFMAATLTPEAVFAQIGASGIAGVVKDTTGAVMPGVTVEASSPALIEKVRTVVSDESGEYKIV